MFTELLFSEGSLVKWEYVGGTLEIEEGVEGGSNLNGSGEVEREVGKM